MGIPNLDNVYVRNFCKKLSNSQPMMISYNPEESAIEFDCINNVQNKIKKDGGRIIYGWLLNEWAKVLIEGQFHAVWKDDDGNMFDLTPNHFGVAHVLFVPDYNIQYKDKQIDNIRKPLSNDKMIINLIKLHEEKYYLLNKGDLAMQYGAIAFNSKHAQKIFLGIEETTIYLINKYGHYV